jgi:hypothetical protein
MRGFRRKRRKPIIVGHPYKTLKFHHKRKKPIPLDDALNEHCLIPGKSGTGKSELAYARWQRAVDEGKATTTVDTHTDLTRRCIRYFIHKGVDPKNVLISDPTYKPEELGAVQLALLEVQEGERAYEAADAVVSDFSAIYGQGIMDRAADILRNCCLTAQEAGLSIVEMPMILTDEWFRAAVIESLQDHDLQNFWAQFSRLKPEQFASTVEAVRNKLSVVALNPYLKPCLSATTSSVNLFPFLNGPRHILINASRDHLKPESRRPFCAVGLSKVHQAIVHRQILPEHQRYPLHLYCDEAPEYYNRSVVLPLMEGSRKWNVGLDQFFQSFSQYPAEDVDVMLGTAAGIYCFAVNRRDAERVAKETVRFSGRQIKEQPQDGRPSYYSIQEEIEHAVNCLMEQGIGECFVYVKRKRAADLPWFGNVVMADKPPDGDEDAFRRESAKHHAQPLAVIKEEEAKRIIRFMKPAHAELYAGPPEREPRRRKR